MTTQAQFPELYATPSCDTVRGQEPRINPSHMPAVRLVEGGKEVAIIVGNARAITYKDQPNRNATNMDIATLFAAAPKLLAYAECEAAYNAPKATFSTINVVLRKHGWTDAHDRKAWMADLRDGALAKARGQQ